MKKLTVVRTLLLVTLVALMALPATFSVTAQNPVKLRFTVWIGAGPSMDMLKGIADEYTKKNPNVTVAFDSVPFGEYTAKVTLQLAGSNPPDGGWILENSAPQFLASGVMVDLAPTLTAYAGYALEDFEKSALGLWVEGSKIFGLPFSTSPFLILYNADVFKAAGLATPNELVKKDAWTWQALSDAAKKIKDSQKIYGFESVDANVYKPGGFWSTLIPIIRAYGGEAWNDKGECLLNSKEAVAAVKLYRDMAMVDKTAVPPGETGDFFSGKSAVTIGQISRVPKLDGAKFAWDVAPLPKGPAGEAATTGQAALAVFRNSPNAKSALDFIAFMTNKENSTKMAQFFPSARKSVLSSEAFLKSNQRLKPEQMQLVVDGVAKGKVLPAHANFSQISLASNAIFDELWVDKADVQAVMDKVCKTIGPLLK